MANELVFGIRFRNYKPHLVMTLSQLLFAFYATLIQSLLAKGINALVLVVYEHTISTVLLSTLAFFVEKERRPPLTFQILCYSFLLGLLQVTICQMLGTVSLSFVGVTYFSTAVNTITAVTFVLAVIFRKEKISFRSVNGQTKMWGVVVSSAGAMMMVLWKGPSLLNSSPYRATTGDRMVDGLILITLAVLAGASASLLVEHVTKKYPADLSLSATVSFFGTIQSSIFTAFYVTKASWILKWDDGLVLLVIFYGGIVAMGILAFVQIWCVRKKGPVFTTAFSPLLIVFSSLQEIFILGKNPHLGSIIGALLVVVGLYMLLWGKANENEGEVEGESSTYTLLA